jgi:hypothetical protein
MSFPLGSTMITSGAGMYVPAPDGMSSSMTLVTSNLPSSPFTTGAYWSANHAAASWSSIGTVDTPVAASFVHAFAALQ